MSTISLTTFAVYKAPVLRPETTDGVVVLTGAREASLSDEGKLQLEIASLPVHSQSIVGNLPREGIMMLYGRQDSLLELQRMRTEARRHDATFAWADIEVDVGEISILTVDRAALRAAGANMRFLNVRRMQSSLQAEVLHRFTQYAISDGSGINEDLKREVQIASRPDLWDRLFRDDKDFAHIDVVVIPIADDPDDATAYRYVAYVRPSARVLRITQGSDHVSLKLPAAFSNSDAA